MIEFREFFYSPSDNEIISLYLNHGHKIKDIMRITNKPSAEIYRILHNNNIKPNRLKTGHDNVISFKNSGLKTNQIAQLTGYSSRNIRYILRKQK